MENGFIGAFKININWAKLAAQSVEIIIEDISVECGFGEFSEVYKFNKE